MATRKRLWCLPRESLYSVTGKDVGFVQTGADTLQGSLLSSTSFLPDVLPRVVREASEIFTCLFRSLPLGSALIVILTGFSPNSAERFPTNNSEERRSDLLWHDCCSPTIVSFFIFGNIT